VEKNRIIKIAVGYGMNSEVSTETEEFAAFAENQSLSQTPLKSQIFLDFLCIFVKTYSRSNMDEEKRLRREQFDGDKEVLHTVSKR
jgi:hypothetical protein